MPAAFLYLESGSNGNKKERRPAEVPSDQTERSELHGPAEERLTGGLF
jgi:hypothetical protein